MYELVIYMLLLWSILNLKYINLKGQFLIAELF